MISANGQAVQPCFARVEAAHARERARAGARKRVSWEARVRRAEEVLGDQAAGRHLLFHSTIRTMSFN